MSKAIKVGDQVYAQLDELRAKGQTFSQIIEDMLKARLKVFELLNVLEGQLKYHEWQQKQLEKLQEANRSGDCPEVRYLQTGEVGPRSPRVPAAHVQVPAAMEG